MKILVLVCLFLMGIMVSTQVYATDPHGCQNGYLKIESLLSKAQALSKTCLYPYEKNYLITTLVPELQKQASAFETCVLNPNAANDPTPCSSRYTVINYSNQVSFASTMCQSSNPSWPNPQPTPQPIAQASLTANGRGGCVSASVGQALDYRWVSNAATSANATYYVESGPPSCGSARNPASPAEWVPVSTNGGINTVVPAGDSGCTFDITFSTKGPYGGASSTLTVIIP